MEDAAIHRIMPNNPEAEQAVIGSMLMDQEAISIASEQLTDEDFYNPASRCFSRLLLTYTAAAVLWMSSP